MWKKREKSIFCEVFKKEISVGRPYGVKDIFYYELRILNLKFGLLK